MKKHYFKLKGILLLFIFLFVLVVTSLGCIGKKKSASSDVFPVSSSKENSIGEVYTIEGKKYELTFYDNFDGKELDNTKWEHCPEWPRQDLKIPWKNEAAYLDGKGNLVIGIEKDEKSGYRTGAIRTRGRFSQAYGYFEIRCKLQKSEGFWTAFWLMGDTMKNVGNGSVDGAEIDIFEALYKEKPTIYQTIHWDGYDTDHRSVTNHYYGNPNIYEGYHTFAVEWSESAYTFYVDGVKTWTTTAGGICTEPLYLKISAEVGTWGGDIKKAILPDNMMVDYVKVYKLVK